MNSKQLAISTCSAFFIIYLFEWIFHGIIMMPAYEATAWLWRHPTEVHALAAFGVMRQLFQAGIMSWLLIRLMEGRPSSERLTSGLYVGLLMGILQFGCYVYMPIPLTMAGAWLAGQTLLGVCVALGIDFVYRVCVRAGA